jgi:hypothetical protein
MFTNFNKRAKFCTSMYCLTINYSFMSTNDSFNNQVTHEPNFIKPSSGELIDNFILYEFMPSVCPL